MAVILKFPQREVTGASALDTLLDRGLITQGEHWCGLHLLWLHKIRMGGGSENVEWREARLHELLQAQGVLFRSGHLTMILNLCVNGHADYRQVGEIRVALRLLAAEWNVKGATA